MISGKKIIVAVSLIFLGTSLNGAKSLFFSPTKLFTTAPLLSSKLLTLPSANSLPEKYGMFTKNSTIFPGDILHQTDLKKTKAPEIITLIFEGNIPVLEELLENKIINPNKNILKDSDLSAFACAIYAALDPVNGSCFNDKNLETIELFINHGAELNKPIPVLYNLPPLNFACTRKNGLPFVKKLVKSGADYKLNVKGTIFSGIPHKIATEQGFKDIAEYLNTTK